MNPIIIITAVKWGGLRRFGVLCELRGATEPATVSSPFPFPAACSRGQVLRTRGPGQSTVPQPGLRWVLHLPESSVISQMQWTILHSRTDTFQRPT